MTTYTGKEFNETFANLSFYKLLYEDFTHHGFTYKNGLNINTKKQALKKIYYNDGLYFTNLYAVQYWLQQLCDVKYIAKVTIPDNALVHIRESDNAYYSDMICLDFSTMINVEDAGTLIKTQEEWNKCISFDKNWILFIPPELEKNFSSEILDRRHIYKNNNYKMIKFDKLQPDEYVCRKAISHDYKLFKYIINQTEELCLFMLTRYCNINKFTSDEKVEDEKIENVIKQIRPEAQTQQVCEFIVKIFPKGLKFIHNQTPELCEIAIYYYPQAIQFVLNKTFKLCKLAVQCDGRVLEHIDEKLFEESDMNILRELAVMSNPLALEHIKPEFQNEKLCQIATNIMPDVIRFVAEQYQTEEYCMKVLSRANYLFCSIKNKTPNICKYAVSRDGYLLTDIKEEDRTEELCKLAAATYDRVLEHVPNQTWEICKISVEKYPKSIKYVRNYSYYMMLLPLSFAQSHDTSI